jgi:PleD family two-component response regulator
MNDKYILLGGGDLQFLNILSDRLQKNFVDREVYTANEAFDALCKIQENQPKVAVLEMIFPQWDWDGYLIFRFLKKDKRFKDMKTILVTDTLDKKAQEIAKDNDIDKVLFKIYNIDYIFEEIRKFI